LLQKRVFKTVEKKNRKRPGPGKGDTPISGRSTKELPYRRETRRGGTGQKQSWKERRVERLESWETRRNPLEAKAQRNNDRQKTRDY